MTEQSLKEALKLVDWIINEVKSEASKRKEVDEYYNDTISMPLFNLLMWDLRMKLCALPRSNR